MIILIFAWGCGTAYEPPPGGKHRQKEQPTSADSGIPDDSVADNAPVPKDGVFEVVTWNIYFYGDKTHGDDPNWDPMGPEDELKQTRNVVKIADSLRADLYAVQEIRNQAAINDIAENMEDYRGFTADHIDWKLKLGFIYNTHTIDSVSSGAITEGQSQYSWSGRRPFYFKFNYMYRGQKVPFYVVNIQAKGNTNQPSYERRKNAAQDLYDYLKENKPDANIIFLGDFNDDVDESIYIKDNGEPAETPYIPFVSDNSFHPLSKTLSDAGKTSVYQRSYHDVIDHIIVNDGVAPYYVKDSIHRFRFGEDYIPDYGETTSDHFPVWAKFDMSRSQ